MKKEEKDIIIHAVPVTLAEPSQNVYQPIVFESHQISKLKRDGYTHGLTEFLQRSCNAIPLRIFIIDNSGSMNTADGTAQVPTQGSTYTRWRELQETIEYHAEMAALLQAPTFFRYLNTPVGITSEYVPQEFSIAAFNEVTLVGAPSSTIAEDLCIAKHAIRNTTPKGVTPLLDHVRDIKVEVEEMGPMLRAEGKRVAVIIATDGLPSDKFGKSGEQEMDEFKDALKELESLPIWLVIRLCTSDESVVNFYNRLDRELEISMDVIDDYMHEAKEIHKFNPWINYTLPLHRMREFGFYHRLFDLLDERKLTTSELRDFCTFLFGTSSMDAVPDSELHLKGFLRAVDKLTKRENVHWHPIEKKLMPLINLKEMRKSYKFEGVKIF